MRKTISVILIVSGVITITILFIILNRSRGSPGISCETEIVGYNSILSKVNATGTLRAKKQVNLQAQLMGVVKKLFVQEGNFVRAGDTLLELERQAYEAQMVLARAQFTQIKLKHARIESLFARGLIAPEQFEASKATYEGAEAQFLQAQDQYNKTIICAPISGIVSRVNIKEGETVIIGTMNNPGTVLLVIADLSQIEVLVEVDETDVLDITPGQSAEITVDAIPDAILTGKVTRVGYMPVQKLLTGTEPGITFEVTLVIDSSFGLPLRPGMTAHAEIITAQLDSVITVPIQAVGRRKVAGRETETVFLVKNGRAVITPVKTGKASDSDIEIIEGVGAGDEVITGPYKVLTKLTDGQLVKPRRVKTETAD
ncbi:MAG: efflux RND transporter periplasmic adaptor subunit [bacterium]